MANELILRNGFISLIGGTITGSLSLDNITINNLTSDPSNTALVLGAGNVVGTRDLTTFVDSLGLVSGSSQITYNQISEIPGGIVSSSFVAYTNVNNNFSVSQTITGNVTASVFIKSGATSDDILLGDGTTTSLSSLDPSSISGLVSGSSQINYPDITNIPGGLVSSSFVAYTNVDNNFSTTQNIDGDLIVTGIITATEFHTDFVSSSVLYSSGSTKFGDTGDDTHEFTGSLSLSGSLLLNSLLDQPAEATALMINGSDVVGTRELGSNAFTSTAYQPAGTYDNYVSWTLAGNSGTNQTISSTNTANIVGSSGITTVGSNTDTLTISHTNSISAGSANSTSTSTLTHGGTFVVPSLSYDANGHITSTSTSTLTLPTVPTYSAATSTTAGIVKLFNDTVQSVAATAVSTTASRTYGIQFNGTGQMVVNVPWTNTGVTTMLAIGSTPNANGATISGTNLTLQPANGSFGGVVTTTTQSFLGSKQFLTDIKIGAAAENTSAKLEYQKNAAVTTGGARDIATISMTSKIGSIIDYGVVNGTNSRIGQLMVVWNGANTQFTDNSTLDIGDTSGVVFSAVQVSTNMVIRATTTTSTWDIRTHVRTI